MSLSIIIPTLRRDTLKRAMTSVSQQTIPTTCIVHYDKDRIGAPKLRNEMIKEVKTTWVGFCDDDDWLDIHYHEWLKYQRADMIIFQMKRPDGMVLPDHTDTDRLAYNWVGISFALRTSIAKQFPFKDRIGEDFDLIQRVVQAGLRVVVLPQVAYFVGESTV
jgi:glycosyltransferase involved in cell wall biosynthesis